jgi:hypothetical protein
MEEEVKWKIKSRTGLWLFSLGETLRLVFNYYVAF